MLEGLALSGRYRLDEFIGQGGMGEVWRATDLHLRRRVAVKVVPLNRSSDRAVVARFRREAEIGASLNHRGITIVHDFGTHEERQIIFLVMEFLDGENLRQRMDREPSGLPLWTVRDFGIQIAAALAAAHSSNVIHRDVKPGNLMVLPDGEVKICDFGIARYTAATSDTTSELVGTPLYMAPEQFNARPVDGRTDLYALGCVLYLLISGQPPFKGDLASVMYQHLQDAPRSLTSLGCDVPPELERIVLACLAKNPVDRPPSAQALADALRRLESAPRAAMAGTRAAHVSGGSAGPDPAPTSEDAPSRPLQRPSGRAPSGGRPRRKYVIGAIALTGVLSSGLLFGLPVYYDLKDRTANSGRRSPQVAASRTPNLSPTVQPPSFLPPDWTPVPVTLARNDGCAALSEGVRMTMHGDSLNDCPLTEEKLEDVAVQADVTFPPSLSDGCIGFFIRRLGAPTYHFEFCKNGEFKPAYWRDNSDSEDLEPNHPRFSPGTSIRVGVWLVRDQLKVYVNDTFLWGKQDDSLRGAGTVAATANFENGDTVTFNALTIWRPKGPTGV